MYVCPFLSLSVFSLSLFSPSLFFCSVTSFSCSENLAEVRQSNMFEVCTDIGFACFHQVVIYSVTERAEKLKRDANLLFVCSGFLQITNAVEDKDHLKLVVKASVFTSSAISPSSVLFSPLSSLPFLSPAVFSLPLYLLPPPFSFLFYSFFASPHPFLNLSLSLPLYSLCCLFLCFTPLLFPCRALLESTANCAGFLHSLLDPHHNWLSAISQ